MEGRACLPGKSKTATEKKCRPYATRKRGGRGERVPPFFTNFLKKL
jgi:hypothetical protein